MDCSADEESMGNVIKGNSFNDSVCPYETSIVIVRLYSEEHKTDDDSPQFWPGRILSRNEVAQEIMGENSILHEKPGSCLVNMMIFQGHHQIAWVNPLYLQPFEDRHKTEFPGINSVPCLKAAVSWASALKEIENLGRKKLNVSDCLVCRTCLDKPRYGGQNVLKRACLKHSHKSKNEKDNYLAGINIQSNEKASNELSKEGKAKQIPMHILNKNAYRYTKDAIICPWRCPICRCTGSDVLLKCNCTLGFPLWFKDKVHQYNHLKECDSGIICFWCQQLGKGSALALGQWALFSRAPTAVVDKSSLEQLTREESLSKNQSLQVDDKDVRILKFHNMCSYRPFHHMPLCTNLPPSTKNPEHVVLCFQKQMGWVRNISNPANDNSNLNGFDRSINEKSYLAKFFEFMKQNKGLTCSMFLLADQLKILMTLSKGKLAESSVRKRGDLEAFNFLLLKAKDGIESAFSKAYSQLIPPEISKHDLEHAMLKARLITASEEVNEFNRFFNLRKEGAKELQNFIERCENPNSGVNLSEAALAGVRKALKVEKKRKERLEAKTFMAKNEINEVLIRLEQQPPKFENEHVINNSVAMNGRNSFNEMWEFLSMALKEWIQIYSMLQKCLKGKDGRVIHVESVDSLNKESKENSLSDLVIRCQTFKASEETLNEESSENILTKVGQNDVINIIGLAHSSDCMRDLFENKTAWADCQVILKAGVSAVDQILDGHCSKAICYIPLDKVSSNSAVQGAMRYRDANKSSINMSAITAFYTRHVKEVLRVALIDVASSPPFGTLDIVSKIHNPSFMLLSLHSMLNNTVEWSNNDSMLDQGACGFPVEPNFDKIKVDQALGMMEDRVLSFRPGTIILTVSEDKNEFFHHSQILYLIKKVAAIAERSCNGNLLVLAQYINKPNYEDMMDDLKAMNAESTLP